MTRVRFSLLLTLALCARPVLAADAAYAGPAADKIAEADRLRTHEWDKGNAQKALPLLDEAQKAGADEYEVRWRKAATYFWDGERYDPDKDGKTLAELGLKCIAEAEAAAKLKADRVEGHYYVAVCWGEYSHGISIVSALTKGVEKKFKTSLDKAMKIDADFTDGGPLNAYGRFYFELPWPKRDLAKSAEYLKRNIKENPCNLRTRVYYVETVLKAGSKVDGRDAKDIAQEQLTFVRDNPHCDANPPDGELAKKKAKKLLEGLK